MLALVHTILGPDHYLPFIALGKARNWTLSKTLRICFYCGIGHVLSSVVIGLIGLAIGSAVFSLEKLEGMRGGIAAWILFVFGFAYMIWGLWRAFKRKPHTHFHLHSDGTGHEHNHAHVQSHTHVHDTEKKKATAWILFLIFIFGPCEPLIPLLIYPAAQFNTLIVVLVALIFSVTTIATMMGMVWVSLKGLSFMKSGPLARYAHSLAGLVIFACGGAMLFLGL